jgi:Nucleotidyl transferase AbiEii toxin, Type IV TA system
VSAQSIRQRLKKRSDELGLEFQQALQYYAIERFLYRLSMTEWADQMIVKGATMLRVWQGVITRPTRDIDFLSRLEDTGTQIQTVVSDCLNVNVPEDGLHFKHQNFEESISIGGRYPGIRVKIRGDLHGAQFVITIDVGVGDATEPGPAWVDYPVLLHGPAPRILTYSPETAIAEKFEAIVNLGLANSRLKDYYDIWILATTDSVSPSELVEAVRATFQRRGAAIPAQPPVGLTSDFANQATTRRMWNAFKMKLRKSDVDVPDTLIQVIEVINQLLLPVYK